MIVEALTYAYGNYNRWRLNRVLDKMTKAQLGLLDNTARLEMQLVETEALGLKVASQEIRNQNSVNQTALDDADAIIKELIEYRSTL